MADQFDLGQQSSQYGKEGDDATLGKDHRLAPIKKISMLAPDRRISDKRVSPDPRTQTHAL